MTHHLVFDIETIPNIPLLRQMLGLGASVSDQQVKDAYLAKTAKKKGEELSDWIGPGLLLPLTIGYLKTDSELNITALGVYDAPRFRTKEATAAFWDDAHEASSLVSFNGRSFDLPVLELQAYTDGLELGWWFKRQGLPTYQQRRNRSFDGAYDLYDIYANFGAHHMVGGLDAMAKRAGCPGKMGTSGDQVWEMHLAGKLAEIADYCQCDVLDTYWVLVRHELQLGRITAARERELRSQFKAEYCGRSPALGAYCALLQIPDVAPPVVRPPKPPRSLDDELSGA